MATQPDGSSSDDQQRPARQAPPELLQISESDEPQPGLAQFSQQQVPPPHPDRVRAWLAGGLLGVVAILVLAAAIGWLTGKTSDQMRDMITLVSVTTTFASAVITFYFSTEKGRNSGR